MGMSAGDSPAPRTKESSFFPAFDIYTYMAYNLAKKLFVNPNDILDSWGVPQLIVAYGQYANEDSYRNYLQWKESRPKGQAAPNPYAVKFLSMDDEDDDTEEVM